MQEFLYFLINFNEYARNIYTNQVFENPSLIWKVASFKEF